MYISLYRRYRPQKFSEMVGQNSAVSVLRESLKEGRLCHAYLFSGPRGCGKTSAARLAAKGLNCLDPGPEGEPCGKCDACISIAQGEHLDVIEIDGASNRGINEIRDLKGHVNLKPLSARYKVYIIDEVHMLTEPAFNALLKTLEEPPANVVFLLATTEPHKVPVTIRSRCQHIPFHRISMSDMVNRVAYVCSKEGINADMEAIWEVSRQADGALRDALSITEQAVSLGKGSLTLESVKALTGGSNRSELEKWIRNLRADPQTANSSLHEMLKRGISQERLVESIFAVFMEMWVYSMWGDGGTEALDISDEEAKFLREETPSWTTEKLRGACMFCGGLLPRARYGMRMEVFSGVLMMELLRITVGGEEIKPLSAPVASKDKASPAKSMVRHGAPSPVSLEPEEAPAEEIIFSEELGADFAKLLSGLGERGVAVGAALLNNPIVIDESGWRFSNGGNSPSTAYLMIPQNRSLISDAIEKEWGVKSSDASIDDIKLPVCDDTAVSGVGGEAKESAAPKKTSAPSVSERVVKLLGAEVLYVKEANPDSEEEDFGGAER